MEYPDDFNTPSYPAGPRIASTRAVSIAIMVVFFLICCACGLLLWVQRSVTVHPFLVSINPITGQWDVVGHSHGSIQEMTTTQSLQESVIGNFVYNWFRISSNTRMNDALWKKCDYSTDCNPEKTSPDETGIGYCALYCLSGEGLFSNFISTVVPDYKLRVAAGETWMVDMPSLKILPLSEPAPNGASWQVHATIRSNKSGPINIMGYALVQRNTETYPQTLGYYVSDFNAYKMN